MNKTVNPKIWGPYAWHILHNISINAKITDETKQNYIDFINIFQHIIPCPRCKVNLKEKYLMIPISLDTITPNNITNWTYTIHNSVNIETNKKEFNYNKHLEIHKKTNCKKYRKFINILLSVMGDNPSFEEFIRIHTFIISLYKIYPLKSAKEFKYFNNYDDISSPSDLIKWFNTSDIFIKNL